MDFKVGDRVRRIRGGHNGMGVGDEATILEVKSIYDFPHSMPLSGFGSGHDLSNFCLAGGGSLLEKLNVSSYEAIKVRIENLSGSSSIKEVDDILVAMGCMTSLSVENGVNLGGVILASTKNDPKQCFQFNGQCDKLRGLKNALLYILDHSGIEKEETYGVGDVISIKFPKDSDRAEGIIAQVEGGKFCVIGLPGFSDPGNRYHDPIDLEWSVTTGYRLSKYAVLKLTSGLEFTLVRKGK